MSRVLTPVTQWEPPVTAPPKSSTIEVSDRLWMCAESGVVTIAEVETLGPLGSIDPDAVMTPGVHVDHIVEVGTGDKPIEQRTVRPKPAEKES